MKASQPGYIGGVEIKNRIAMAPMISNMANIDGSTNDSHISYLEERAKGGVGLIITEYTYVDDQNSRGSLNELGAFDKRFVPKLRRLTDRMHLHDTKVFMQLVHCGGKAHAEINPKESYAPSAMNYLGKEIRGMSSEEIEELIENYIKAAKIAFDSRFDGIELHGAHGYLLEEFISPALNVRDDRYGGSFENRLRVPQEIIDGIKGEIDIPVGIRLSLLEFEDDGYGPDYGLNVSKSLKNLDYVHFSAGRHAPPGSSGTFYRDHLHVYRYLSDRPKIPTMVVGSVTNREDVEEALSKADFVAIGRGHLADPYIAQKILTDPKTIRPCILCNQACRDLSLGEVRCTVNPDLGYERQQVTFGNLSGEVVIVGGGVKGLEAALTAAKSGLSVTLYEKNEELGGQILEISDRRKRLEFGNLINYYKTVLEKMNVEIITGEEYLGEGVYCLPDKTYPDVKETFPMYIDSNVFKYHDLALKLAENGEVYLSNRSLRSLDRSRSAEFKEIALSKGIKFVDHKEHKFNITLIEREQYDIRKAMLSGRDAIYRDISARTQDFL